MIARKLTVCLITIFMSGVLNLGAMAAEVKKQPLTQEEINLFTKFGDSQIQRLIVGDAEIVGQTASQIGVEQTQLHNALAQLNQEGHQTLISVSPEIIDAVVAGAMEGGDILITALAAVGLLFLIAAIAA